jgi:hypothetical protein
MASGKELQNLFKACEDQGFQVERTKRGHWRVRDETGRPVTTFGGTSTSPSGWRNGLAHLKRAGLIWPPASR